MATRLVYYSEELDMEIEVKPLNKNFNMEEHTPKKCVFTGKVIEDYYFDDVEE